VICFIFSPVVVIFISCFSAPLLPLVALPTLITLFLSFHCIPHHNPSLHHLSKCLPRYTTLWKLPLKSLSMMSALYLPLPHLIPVLLQQDNLLDLTLLSIELEVQLGEVLHLYPLQSHPHWNKFSLLPLHHLLLPKDQEKYLLKNSSMILLTTFRNQRRNLRRVNRGFSAN